MKIISRLWLLPILLIVLSACNDEKKQTVQSIPTVEAIRVSPQNIPLDLEYSARTQGSKETVVRARVGGILLKRNYIEGAKVNEGDVLFEIDPEPYKVALQQAQAKLAQTKAQLTAAESQWKRISKLFEERIVSEKSRDEAKANLEALEASLKLAQAEVDSAQLNLDYTTVTAPVGGLTSLETQSEGSLISATGSDSLLTHITQTDPIYVIFSASEGEISSLINMGEKGLIKADSGCTTNSCRKITAKLKLGSGDTYKEVGYVNFINPTIDENTGTVKLRAVFPNPDGKIKPGQFVRLVMEGITRLNALVVPQEAIMQGSTGSFVYKVNDKGLVEPVNVITGLSTEDEGWIIDSGLKDGDIVITSNLMKLRTGMPVSAQISTEQATTAGVTE